MRAGRQAVARGGSTEKGGRVAQGGNITCNELLWAASSSTVARGSEMGHIWENCESQIAKY